MNQISLDNSVMVNFDSIDFRDVRFTTFGHTATYFDVLFVGDNSCMNQNEIHQTFKCLQIKGLKDAISWVVSQKHSGHQLPKVIVCNTMINGESTLGAIHELKANIDFQDINIIYLTSEFNQEEMQQAIRTGADDYFSANITCQDLLTRINFLIKLSELKANKYEEPLTINEDLKPKFWRLKRAFDILVSFATLLLLTPILLIIAIAIKLDSKGPVFYISKRAGKGYQIFDFYKFRTMRKDADTQVDQLKHLNQYGNNEGGESENSVFFKVKNDPRITKLGGFLRKTSLDEIPQLFNVLKGDMSLVGNRPLPLYEAEKLTQDQFAMRFLAPAGITGLWQITKRGKEDMSESERVSLDMEYAEKNSFWYDVKIMLKTPTALLQKEQV